MYRLIYKDGDTPQTHTFATGEVIIGRTEECQIILQDPSISRRHAKVVVDQSGVRVFDLKSKNGTKLNGTQVMEAVLKNGDRLHLGKFQITFSDALESRVILDDDKPLSEEAGTIIRSVGELSRLLDEAPPPKEPTDQKPVPSDVEDIGKANRILKVLTKVAKILIAVRPVEEVLHQVMDVVFEHVPADRGFLMLRDESGSGELVPMVVKHRDPSGGEDRITISKTIADTVMNDHVAILTSDAMVDPRFGAGDSIRFHGIRSAMCAPLWHEDQVIGIVHVDSPMLTNCFTADDLDLLTALANYAAVAVERARLNQKIVAEEKKRERLGRFLSPQVTNRILAASDTQASPLGDPEVREVSVLFADISGFTRLSEKMSPSAVAVLLNSYLSRMTDVIFKYEGTLDKYMGDGIMAVFGAPLDMEDHAERSIRAALEMQEQLAEWNAERTEGPELRIRIGINSGTAVAGEIGSVNKMEYTVLGDTVNTASRLESAVAKPGSVVVGEQTRKAVGDIFECEELGSFSLKGKENEVEVFKVHGLSGGGSETKTVPEASGEASSS